MINRRQLLKSAGLLGLFGAGFGFRSIAENNNNKKRVLRFAHLTDVHIEPELNAPAGLAKMSSSSSITKRSACIYYEWR